MTEPLQNLKILSTAELVELYNKATGKSIKRFATRAAGERQTLAALTAPATPSSEAVAPPKVVASRPAPKSRKVNGAAGGKTGRPPNSFTVLLTAENAKSKLQKNSLRQKVVDFLGTQKGKQAAIEAIEKRFNANMRGVIAKLKECKWIKISELA